MLMLSLRLCFTDFLGIICHFSLSVIHPIPSSSTLSAHHGIIFIQAITDCGFLTKNGWMIAGSRERCGPCEDHTDDC